jgi:hypothetical protein
MYQKERLIDPEFTPQESLFRRVSPFIWDDWKDDGDIELDAIQFPDMSVNREKYGPAESARWERGKYVDWGVVGFLVGDIPSEILYQGAVIYRLKAAHKPERRNYPHSEVQAFEAKWESPQVEIHIDESTMPGVPLEAQQEWRELLRRKCRITLRPGEEAPNSQR